MNVSRAAIHTRESYPESYPRIIPPNHTSSQTFPSGHGLNGNSHGQTCDYVRVQSATQRTASVHALHFYTCPNLRLRSCSKCYAMDCFGTCFTLLHMPKPVITFVFKVLRNGLLRYILYTLHMPKPVITFVCKVLRNGLLRYILCTLRMPKPVITFVFKVLRNGLLRYILYTCPNLLLRSCSKCNAMDCFGTYFTLYTCPITCDHVRVQSATQWTASVHALHFYT